MKTLTLALTLLTTTSAFALDFDGIRNWTGAGPNRAALVLDFNDGAPATAWGFYFSGPSTGFDMLGAIAAADPSLAFEVTQYSFGPAVTRFTYGARTRSGFDAGTSGYWAYYTANGTTTQPSAWTSSNVGAADRPLADGGWDGWTWAPNFAASPPSATILPAAPVPEPASLLALGLGGAALLRRRSRRRARD